MSTLDQFVTTYLGKGIDWGNQAAHLGYQCMLLAETYNHEVVGAPPLGGNAIDVWSHYPQAFYMRVANTPQNQPEPGSIVIWGGPNAAVGTTRFGHIAICLSATASGFTSLDQNWPEGSRAHKQSHSYTAVLGWLHPLAAPGAPIDEAAGNKIRHVQGLTENVARANYGAAWAAIVAWVAANK